MTNKYCTHIIGHEYHLSLIFDFMEVIVDNTVVLSVGDKFHLSFSKDRIYYGGMPSEKVFSIVQRKSAFPYMGFAWNLYFPRGKAE